MTEAELRAELCRVGRSLHARGYVHGTTGNLSARLPDGVLITATDACLGDLVPDAIVKVDATGTPADPNQRPSKTLALHRRIYAAEPEAGAVVHTHAFELVRATLAVPMHEGRADLLPPLTPYFVMKVGHVPLVPYRRPGDPAVADLVATAIAEARARGTPIRAVVLARLGPNAWHATPAAAMAVLEELEDTARLFNATRDDPPAPLGETEIADLRTHAGARW